jgi:Uma2 family endonuclease
MSTVVIEDRVRIPDWVVDHASYRRWAGTDQFPEQGWLAFLDGEIWVDLSMEQFFSHNQVKAAFTYSLMRFLEANPIGRYVPDRMLLTHVQAKLSTEPDGLFYTWETMQTGRLRLVESDDHGAVELEGTPDMVLEIISQTSVRKDTVRLRELYFRAGIAEYWLVDARGDEVEFDVLSRGANGYQTRATIDGWSYSALFGQDFKVTRQTDPVGHPQFSVSVRAHG